MYYRSLFFWVKLNTIFQYIIHLFVSLTGVRTFLKVTTLAYSKYWWNIYWINEHLNQWLQWDSYEIVQNFHVLISNCVQKYMAAYQKHTKNFSKDGRGSRCVRKSKLCAGILALCLKCRCSSLSHVPTEAFESNMWMAQSLERIPIMIHYGSMIQSDFE